MKTYLITISINLPYPKEFKFQEKATNVAPAVSRTLKALRKEIGRKKIDEWTIKVLASKTFSAKKTE